MSILRKSKRLTVALHVLTIIALVMPFAALRSLAAEAPDVSSEFAGEQFASETSDSTETPTDLGLAVSDELLQTPAPKVVICHATSSPSNPYVRIEVSSKAEGGHFY